jgi:hypothetical protein
VITQTWRSKSLPEAAERLRYSWTRNNPDLVYRLFDDDACAEVIAEIVPQFLDDYLNFPHPVMRADFFRYAVIYRDGGIYADIDMECVRPMQPLLSIAPAIFSIEAHLSSIRQAELGYAKPVQIANCIFAARSGHPFLQEAMERSIELVRKRPRIARCDIEDLTGPRMLTRLFFEKPRFDIAVLEQIVLMPPRHYPDIWPLNANIHTRHHFFGSWKSQSVTRTIGRMWIERDCWPNPFPASYLDTKLTDAAWHHYRQRVW